MIELLEPAGGPPSDAPTFDRPAFPAALPRAPKAERPKRRPWRRRVRPAVVLLVVIIIGWFVQTRLVSSLIHQQRQHHLAADLTTPTPSVQPGHALGLLQVPSLGINEVMVEDVTPANLRGGPAHLASSALPGDAGVMVVYGHRSTYGRPFARLVELQQGDDVVAQARSGGPIVRYIVDRVERHSSVDRIELPTPDAISYLLLVTSEAGTFEGDEVVVVARALPVTDVAPVVPDLAATVDGPVPLSVDSLLLTTSLGAFLAWSYLRRRVTTGVMIAAVAPLAVFASLRVALVLESVLPLTR